jgi:hypothetical protein
MHIEKNTNDKKDNWKKLAVVIDYKKKKEIAIAEHEKNTSILEEPKLTEAAVAEQEKKYFFVRRI